MKTLAIYSNKGGVGKTAAAVNLAYLAAQTGAKTLICDLDPQSSTTYYFRIKPKLKPKARGLSKGGKRIDNSIKGTDYQNLDLLPADLTHRNLDITFDKLKRSKHRLEKILKPLQDEYDLVILDSPSTINLLAENIIIAADYIFAPLIPTTLSVRTHRQLVAFCQKRKYDTRKIHPFFSMVDRRKKLHRELMAMISEDLEGMLKSSIPYSAVIEQMGLAREPVAAFAPNSVAAKAYQSLWAEIKAKALPTNPAG
ncbi:MAG: ParA family protein [Anaerolineae bacterium]|nr:ParA family protein [Anaerolineae bacterium]